VAPRTRPIGQELEIVPAVDPTRLEIGARLPVQVLFRGKPLAGRAITAVVRHRGKSSAQTMRTDAQGRVRFRIGDRGSWIVRLVHMELSREPGADWRSYWASLTFSLRNDS
jgi:uncharacterized GH25 family protein